MTANTAGSNPVPGAKANYNTMFGKTMNLTNTIYPRENHCQNDRIRPF